MDCERCSHEGPASAEIGLQGNRVGGRGSSRRILLDDTNVVEVAVSDVDGVDGRLRMDGSGEGECEDVYSEGISGTGGTPES